MALPPYEGRRTYFFFADVEPKELMTFGVVSGIQLDRLRYHRATKDYVERRTSEGKSKREIIRCLKRYVAPEIYAALTQTGDQELARAA